MPAWTGGEQSVRAPGIFFGSKLTIHNEDDIDTTDDEKTERRRMVERMDYEEVERVEAELDNFISKRSREREEANRTEAAWAESTRRVNEKRRRSNRMAWIDYFGHMNRLHLSLAADHADKRGRLMAEAGYEPEESPGPEAA